MIKYQKLSQLSCKLKLNYSVISTIVASIIFGTVIMIGCSSSKTIKSGGTLNLMVKPNVMNVWVNLMPGTRKPKLHVLGEANVKNLSDNPIKNLVINKIEIYQDQESLFSFTPDFDQQNVTGSLEFLPGELRLYAFSTKSGLDVVQNLNFDEPISVVIEFSSYGDTYFATVDSVKIKRVY